MTSAYIQDALEMVLSNAVARRAPILVKPDAPAWLSIADEHMGDYSFVVPTADELKAADVRQVVLSLENYREGEVGLEVLANGPPVPRALAQIVEAYRAAGISVQVKGLESQDLRPERPFAELDRPSPGHLAHSPTFVAIAREAWLPPADYGSLTRQQALAFLARERESYLSRGPSWQAQVARVDQAIAEVTAEQTGD